MAMFRRAPAEAPGIQRKPAESKIESPKQNPLIYWLAANGIPRPSQAWRRRRNTALGNGDKGPPDACMCAGW